MSSSPRRGVHARAPRSTPAGSASTFRVVPVLLAGLLLAALPAAATASRPPDGAVQRQVKQLRAHLVVAKRDLGRARAGARAARVSLAQTRTNLTRTRSDLTRTRSDLTRTQSDLTRTRSDLSRTRSDLSRTRSALDAADGERDAALAALRDVIGARDMLGRELEVVGGERAAAIAERDERMPRRAEVAHAAERVATEVAYLEHTLRSRDVRAAHERLLALSAMGYVVGHVSAPLYGYRNEIEEASVSPRPEEALASGAGICGAAAWTMAAILARFDLPVRSVQIYDGVDNHIAVEVRYDDAWHYYDPTWGAMYMQGGRVLSLAAARRAVADDEKGVELVYDRSLPWRFISDELGILDVTFATSAATWVEYDVASFTD